MLQGLRHGHPLLNGYSGFFPRPTRLMRGVLRRFPDRRSLRFLANAGCHYVVIDRRWLDHRGRTGRAWSALRLVHEDSDRIIFELGPVEVSASADVAPGTGRTRRR
jgi:hypothetical protein